MMKKYFVIFVSSVTISIALCFLRAYSIMWACIVISVVYSLFTHLVLKKEKKCSHNKVLIPFLLFAGYILPELPFRIVEFHETKLTLWGTLCVLVSIIFTTFFHCFKRKGLLILYIMSWLYLVTIAHKTWLEYVVHGSIEVPVEISEFKLNMGADSVQIKDIKGEYILIDFWSSNCGVCFKKFPKIQELYDNFKDNDNVMITSVFIASENESYFDGVDILHDMGYTFPIIGWTDWKSPLVSELGINVVPTVVILDREKKVVFRGSIEFAIKELRNINTNLKNKKYEKISW